MALAIYADWTVCCMLFRFGDIAVKVLPLDIYADGKWYEMSEEQRKKSHPLIVNNNWVLGKTSGVVISSIHVIAFLA